MSIMATLIILVYRQVGPFNECLANSLENMVLYT